MQSEEQLHGYDEIVVDEPQKKKKKHHKKESIAQVGTPEAQELKKRLEEVD